jgi:hypothetical protein
MKSKQINFLDVDLDLLFNENGYKNPELEYKCRHDKSIKYIKLTRSKNTPLTIADGFLLCFEKLDTIDLSELSSIKEIGACFMWGCNKLKKIIINNDIYIEKRIKDYFTKDNIVIEKIDK